MELYSKVPVDEPNWLIKGMFAYGMTTVIVGKPGTAKDTLGIALTARITRGLPMPDGTPTVVPGSVVMVNPEDPKDIVVKPRLIAANADDTRVCDSTWVTPDQPLRLPQDIAKLEQDIGDLGHCRMVWLSPLRGLAGVPMGSNDKMRLLLMRLDAMAAKRGVCVGLTHHFTKDGKIGGSTAVVEYPRTVLIAERVDGSDIRTLRVAESNIVVPESVPPLRFVVKGDAPYSYAEFLPPDDAPVDEDDQDDDERPDWPRENTTAWLILHYLRDRLGPAHTSEIAQDLEVHDYTVRVLVGRLLKRGLVEKDAPGVYHAVTVTSAPDQQVLQGVVVTSNSRLPATMRY